LRKQWRAARYGIEGKMIIWAGRECRAGPDSGIYGSWMTWWRYRQRSAVEYVNTILQREEFRTADRVFEQTAI